uniref:Large ribosomal subunit protein P1 n=1 Tax=Thermofilum pendens TaxID=2269 RepID=A0A7C3WMC2_THEPE
MEYVYASLILYHAGRDITEESVRKILEAAGIQVDEARLKAMIAALREVNIGEAIKTAALPVAPVAAAAAPTAPAQAAAPVVEEKKEEKKEEAPPEESIEEGLAALFGF